MPSYLVFARTQYDEPLEHRGEVEADGNEGAKRLALQDFGEDWIEMSLVPMGSVYWAEKDEAEVGA